MNRRLRIAFVAALLLTAGTVAFRWSVGRKEPDEEAFIPQNEVITPEIRLLQRYTRIDTSNPPGNETAGARFLIAELRKGGMNAELIESAPGRGNVYARIKGRTSGEGLMLLHHIDVVPADAKQWTVAPFAGRTLRNELYGRGVLDMKGIGICHLLAFLEVARRHQRPERDIVFLAVADEEVSSRFGMEWLLANRPDVFAGVRYALNEGGITETIKGAITYFGIETGSKQIVKFVLRASTREKLLAARIALEPLFVPDEPDRVLPEVRRFFRAIAPHRLESGALLKDIDATIAAGKFWLVPQGMRELTYNNAWLLGVDRDDRGPKMEGTLLNLPDEEPDARIADLEKRVAPFGLTIEILDKTGPSPISSDETPFFRFLTSEIRRQYGNVDVGPDILALSRTDCRYLRHRGVQCYGLWPFPVDVYETGGIHGRDERVRLDWFGSGATLERQIVLRHAFSRGPSQPVQGTGGSRRSVTALGGGLRPVR